MTVELMQTLSLVFYLLAAVMFFMAIALFFLLRVPSLFGDITGSTARKAIESIRLQNENSGEKAYKPSPVNVSRSMITEKISKSGRLGQRPGGLGGSPGTEKFSTTQLSSYANDPVFPVGAAETSVLDQSNNETTLLNPEFMPSGETTVLSQNEFQPAADTTGMDIDGNFSMDVEISFTGSSEMVI